MPTIEVFLYKPYIEKSADARKPLKINILNPGL